LSLANLRQVAGVLCFEPMRCRLSLCPQPSKVDACEVRLVEINHPLCLPMASLAERSQIPR
jgi:hypothetical protein